MIKKVAFTMIPVKDLARAREFYEKKLGLVPGKDYGNADWMEYDLPSGGCVALWRNDFIAPSDQAGSSVVMEVDDIEAETARLKAAGVDTRMELIESPVCRMSVFVDSEGNAFSLHQVKRR